MPYSCRQMYDLIAEVDKYDEFLPWCRAARILERHDGWMLAELVISFKHITEQYTSKVTLSPPEQDHTPAAIDVRMTHGPFKHLINEWRFEPAAQGGCRVEFFLDFKFRSKILDALIGRLFAKATEKMVSAFQERAHALYGSKT